MAALGARINELDPALHLTGTIAGGEAFKLTDHVQVVGSGRQPGPRAGFVADNER